jgi:hypothetical protein
MKSDVDDCLAQLPAAIPKDYHELLRSVIETALSKGLKKRKLPSSSPLPSPSPSLLPSPSPSPSSSLSSPKLYKAATQLCRDHNQSQIDGQYGVFASGNAVIGNVWKLKVTKIAWEELWEGRKQFQFELDHNMIMENAEDRDTCYVMNRDHPLSYLMSVDVDAYPDTYDDRGSPANAKWANVEIDYNQLEVRAIKKIFANRELLASYKHLNAYGSG